MTQSAAPEHKPLLECFKTVCQYLEEENALLQADDFAQAVAVLPRKQAAIQELEAAVAAIKTGATDGGAAGQALLTADIEAAVKRFNALAQLNHQLLQKAVAVQSEIVTLILDNVAKEQQAGYSATGHYATSKNADGAFTLSSNV